MIDINITIKINQKEWLKHLETCLKTKIPKAAPLI